MRTIDAKPYLHRLAEAEVLAETWVDDAHREADNILCEFLTDLGYADVVEAYYNIEPKWYS